MKFQSKYKTFHSRKCIWRYRLRNGGHFVHRPRWQQHNENRLIRNIQQCYCWMFLVNLFSSWGTFSNVITECSLSIYFHHEEHSAMLLLNVPYQSIFIMRNIQQCYCWMFLINLFSSWGTFSNAITECSLSIYFHHEEHSAMSLLNVPYQSIFIMIIQIIHDHIW